MSGLRGRDGTGSRAGLLGWVLFDWAAQPFYTLVLTFLFAPYFANVVVGDPVAGQAAWGYASAAGGLVVALASPLLGAAADASGRRKPWVAAFSLAFVLGLAGLWLAAPAAPSTWLPLLAFVVALVAAEFATVFTNAMMPSLVPPHALGRLSGIGWATGYAGGLVSLVVAAALLIGDAAGGRTLLGLTPPLPLDFASHQGERLIGPFCALWYVVFMLPFFLFTPDAPGRGSAGSPWSTGIAELLRTLRGLRRSPSVLLFLLAHMLYVDGLGAIFAFGGIYAAAQFGWTSMDLGLFGIVLTLTGALGAAVGGVLDDRFGARAVILGALVLLAAAALGVVSIDRDGVLFVLAAAPREGAAFSSVPERLYLVFAILIGLAAGPLQAASRSLMARLAPPHLLTEYFGLYAFSGKITAFAAPFLVAAVTAASGSQRLGIASVLLFLTAGFALMLAVREKP